MLENFFGPKCIRCGGKNDKQAEFCEHCGISLAFSRPAILNDNRWEPAPDELAVFFKSRDLKGLFTKTLLVPPGTRALIFQENRHTVLETNEYPLETLFERLNTFFTGKPAEILITRKGAIPVDFVFDDILCADLLPLTVETTIFVRVGEDLPSSDSYDAFRNHFMSRPGAVTTGQLRELLGDSVRQIIAESLGGKRLEEMAGGTGLREELNIQMKTGLFHRFRDYGLSFNKVDTLSVRHDRFDANRKLKGSYWLEYDEAKIKAEHRKTMAELYNQEEWAEIKVREEEMRRRHRNAELSEDEAELVQVIRNRELDNLEKIAAADTREKAIDLGAREQVEVLEQEYQARRRERKQGELHELWKEDEAQALWLHTKAIAGIRFEAEKKVAQAEKEESERIALRQIDNTLEKIRIEGEIERARLIEDEEVRKQRLNAEAEMLMKNSLREQALLDTNHQVAVDGIRLAGEVHRRTENRVQAEEDKRLEEKIAEIEARIKRAKDEDKQKGLDGLIQLNEKYELSKVRVKMHEKREEQALHDEKEDKALDRKIKEQAEHRKTAQEERLDNIRHMGEFNKLSPDAMLALCNPANLNALLEYRKIKAYGEMSEEKIRAIQGAQKAPAAPDGAFYAASSQSAVLDALIEELSKSKVENRPSYKDVLTHVTQSNKEAQDNLLKAATLIKDTAVAFAHGGNNRQPQETTPPQPQPTPQFARTGSQPALKVCTGCKSVIDFNLSVCPACGRPLV